MIRFSVEEKRDMYDVYIRNFRNSILAGRSYAILYPERIQPSVRIFQRISTCMVEEGRVLKKRNKYHVRPNANEINVLAQIYINPENSTVPIARECNITSAGVKKILKKHKFHDYKFHPVQQLHAEDPERRLTFCNWFNIQNTNPEFCESILWSDESSFTNCGIFNRKNKHYWATGNPHLVQEIRPQVRFKINIWCGLVADRVIGPVFLENNLNSVRYLHLLQHDLESLLDEVPLAVINKIKWFQQDGCPAHNALIIRNYLNERFPENWMGTYGPVLWPPRSPCLNPLDYFLWGHLQNKVYYNHCNNIQELRQRIIDAFQTVSPDMVRHAIRQIRERTNRCIENQGGHFEHLMK